MDFEKTREYVVDSAAILIQENGSQPLELEKIAEAGSLSVEDIRAAFPDIRDLLAAVIERMFASFLDRIEDERGPETEPGSWTRAYIRAGFPEEDLAFPEIAAAILKTIPLDPAMLEPVRAQFDGIREHMEADGIDTVKTDIIRATIDGMFMGQIFGIEVIPEERTEAVRDRLLALTRDTCASPS